jgi:radical SAM superfamily enzyme YgiQ (UPF0313 family)
MKVLLISANILREPYPVYPLGLDYIAGAITGAHQVHCLDLNSLVDEDDGLPRAVGAFEPDIIAISLRNIDNTDALHPQGFMAHYQQLVQTVRRCSAAPIVLGGTGFTLFAHQIMRLLEADYGIVGEGERLALLLKALEQGEDPASVPGVIVGQSVVRDPDPWPHPVVRRFDPQGAHLDFYLRHGGMLNLQTKRGCPFRCIYCSYPYIEGRTLRLAPPEQLARTAVELQGAGARYLFVTDSAFNADGAHSLAVAQAFKRHGLTIPWGGFFAPVPMPADYFTILADCGLKHVEFGTESLCDAVLAAYHKPFMTCHVFAAHQAALAAGLHVAHYFLFGGPGETAQTLAESFSHMDTLQKTVLFLFCGMRIYPHTSLYEIALRQGQLSAGQSILEPVFYQPPSMSLTDIACQVETHAQGREHWVRGAGGERTIRILSRMYQRGRTGPLWEYLIR